MDEFTQKVNQLIDQKLASMTNMANGNHLHNGYDVNQLDPAVALNGWPTIQVADASVAPTDNPNQGTFRFYVDVTPDYYLWVYTTYETALGVKTPAWKTVILTTTGISTGAITPSTISQTGLTIKYNNITTAGWGIPAIYGSGRQTGKTAAASSLATYTVGAADGSFIVSANILVTTATSHNFVCTCTYTDEGNTPRVLTFTFSNVGATFLTLITNAGGTVPYEGIPLHIRAKAGTAITVDTGNGGGTNFTSVVYNVEASIMQIA